MGGILDNDEESFEALINFEGNGIIVSKDARAVDVSQSELPSLLASGSLSIQRDPKVKYNFYAGRDKFPVFYQREFESIEQVEAELRRHAAEQGFEIRLSNIEKDLQGVVRMRRFVCSCEGKRRSTPADNSGNTNNNNSKTSGGSASSGGGRKTSRCGCPYFVVYKRRPSERDASKFVYRAHSLDTFHSHLRTRESEAVTADQVLHIAPSLPASSTCVDVAAQKELQQALADLICTAMRSSTACREATQRLRALQRDLLAQSRSHALSLPLPLSYSHSSDEGESELGTGRTRETKDSEMDVERESSSESERDSVNNTAVRVPFGRPPLKRSVAFSRSLSLPSDLFSSMQDIDTTGLEEEHALFPLKTHGEDDPFHLSLDMKQSSETSQAMFAELLSLIEAEREFDDTETSCKRARISLAEE